MRARLLAVLGAVLMIVAAIAIRSRIDSGSSGGSSDSGSGRHGIGTVVCDTALGDACPAGAEGEAARATAKALMIADSGPGAWLTMGRWPEAVDKTRALASRPPLFATTTPVASTKLVLVVRTGGLACPQPVTWTCVGDATAGGVLIAAPPASTSDGIDARAAFLSARLATTDWGTSDIDAATTDWIQRVSGGLNAAGSLDGGAALEDWAQRQFAGPVGFLATQADVIAVLGSATGTARVDVITPQPAVTIEAVAGQARNTSYDTRSFRKALVSNGWTTPPAKGSGLPSPDVLYALQDVVR